MNWIHIKFFFKKNKTAGFLFFLLIFTINYCYVPVIPQSLWKNPDMLSDDICWKTKYDSSMCVCVCVCVKPVSDGVGGFKEQCQGERGLPTARNLLASLNLLCIRHPLSLSLTLQTDKITSLFFLTVWLSKALISHLISLFCFHLWVSKLLTLPVSDVMFSYESADRIN